MEERGYVAEALLERLRTEGIGLRVVDDPELNLAVPRGSLEQIPRLVARFAQDIDLRFVGLERPSRHAWRTMLAWTDEVGQPRFLAARFFVGAEEGDAPAALFACGLVDAVERASLPEERAAWLTARFNEDPAGATEHISRRWRNDAHARLIAQAARHGNWAAVRSRMKELRRGLRLIRAPQLRPSRVTVLFAGRETPQRSNLMTHVQGRLAPLGLDIFEDHAGNARGADFRVVFDGPEALDSADAVCVRNASLPAMVSQVERALLRWLEWRVERRFPEAVVGANPLSARLLQTPGLGALMGWLLQCRIHARLRSPLLMPVPMGIVIEDGVQIGSRVTVMHQTTIGRKNPVGQGQHGGGLPVIEDNVFIGAGAKVLGPVRIGRGATVGANAVVTRDVPSHCTVVGANRILGITGESAEPGVGTRRHEEVATVVNT
ncbi:MAG TPA: serine acetyltransferase [Burkholderiales bacterium]|nr:serine acetyltransferase [Burkholderiales bacterium]